MESMEENRTNVISSQKINAIRRRRRRSTVKETFQKCAFALAALRNYLVRSKKIPYTHTHTHTGRLRAINATLVAPVKCRGIGFDSGIFVGSVNRSKHRRRRPIRKGVAAAVEKMESPSIGGWVTFSAYK